MQTISVKVKLACVGQFENFNGSAKEAVKQLAQYTTEDLTPITYCLDFTRTHETVYVNNNIFYVFPEGNGIKIYRKLPLVHTDKVFNWEKDYKNCNKGSLHCILQRGQFTYYITANTATGEAKVSVKFYMKFSSGDVIKKEDFYIFTVPNATNVDLFKAIRHFEESFDTLYKHDRKHRERIDANDWIYYQTTNEKGEYYVDCYA